MLLQVILDADDGHPVDARTTLIGPHLPQCCLQVFSLTYCLHQSIRAGWVFVPIRRPGRFSLYPSRLSGFTRQHRREVQFHLEILLRVVLEIHGLLTAPSRSGLQPPFPARPIHCSAFRHSECLTSLADVMTCRVGGGALARWPPSAAQTVHAVFPHTAFTKTHSSGMSKKESTELSSQARTLRTTWSRAVASSRCCAIGENDVTGFDARSNH